MDQTHLYACVTISIDHQNSQMCFREHRTDGNQTGDASEVESGGVQWRFDLHRHDGARPLAD